MPIINYPFNISTNYTYDPLKSLPDGGENKLILEDLPDQVFTESFDNDTGFTYDSNKAEFVGGKVQQKSQAPANSLSWATYTSSINLSVSVNGGGLTGVGVGSPGITGNKLDLTGDTIKYVTYDADGNADSQQTGTIKIKVTPNYNTKPTHNQYIFSVGKAVSSFNNLIEIYHNAGNGYLSYVLYNSAGVLQSSGIFGVWNTTSGVTYELCLCFDFTTGATRMFVDGVQSGSTLTNTFTRDSDIGFFRIGNNRTATYESNSYFEDLIYFSTSLYTTNYAPGYTLQEYEYIESNVTLPEMEYTGVGTLQEFQEFATTEGNSPRYTLQIGRSGDYLFWNGSVWAVSDGTYAEANDATTFNANVSSLVVAGEIYGQFKIHFQNSNSQSYVDELSATLTGQTYPVDNPVTLFNTSIRHDGLISFVETSSKSGSDEIKYTISKNGTQYYWNGSAWVISDGTYSQANTAAEINSNLSSFADSPTTTFFRQILHSDNGLTTPVATNVEVEFSFAGSKPSLTEVIIYGYLRNLIEYKSGSTVKVRPTWKIGDLTVLAGDYIEEITVVEGYFEVNCLIETGHPPTHLEWVFGDKTYITNFIVADQVKFSELTILYQNTTDLDRKILDL